MDLINISLILHYQKAGKFLIIYVITQALEAGSRGNSCFIRSAGAGTVPPPSLHGSAPPPFICFLRYWRLAWKYSF